MKNRELYAVLFDLDTNCLSENCENITYHNAYKTIKDYMLSNGFEWKQGSVYFGKEHIDAVSCVLTVQKLAKLHPWFSTCVKDVRMLKIEENNDLAPAVQMVFS